MATTITLLPPPVKEPELNRLKPKYDQFCIGIVAGMGKAEAYFAAGFKSIRGTRCDGPARLLKRDDVQARIRQLQAMQAMRLNVSMDTLILELEEAREVARRDLNAGAMVAATLGKAKLLGFLIDKPFDDGRTPKPSPVPTDVVEMTEEDWLAKFKPPTLQ
jgi:hypothetical protein